AALFAVAMCGSAFGLLASFRNLFLVGMGSFGSFAGLRLNRRGLRAFGSRRAVVIASTPAAAAAAGPRRTAIFGLGVFTALGLEFVEHGVGLGFVFLRV